VPICFIYVYSYIVNKGYTATIKKVKNLTLLLGTLYSRYMYVMLYGLYQHEKMLSSVSLIHHIVI